MTIDELKVLAEKAKAWRPDVHCMACSCRVSLDCDRCAGAKRACEDIAENVDEAALDLDQVWWCGAHGEYVQPIDVTNEERHDPRAGGCGGSVDSLASRRVECAEAAARIASYFGSEDTPVHRFAAAVREFCK